MKAAKDISVHIFFSQLSKAITVFVFFLMAV